MTEIERITHYTNYEGGNWLSVNGHSDFDKMPSEEKLEYAQKHIRLSRYGGGQVASINKRMMHSFKTSLGREWDVLNGWRVK